jgi:hypothetical protein
MTFQPGNKLGSRRKDKIALDALLLEMKAAEEIRGMRIIARALLDLAAGGDLPAIKEVFNRIDGMPVQQIDQTIENISYVAELPPVATNTPEWLKIAAPKPNLQ